LLQFTQSIKTIINYYRLFLFIQLIAPKQGGNMSNSLCPLCDKKTQGKAVRRINFCKAHRELAVFIRDDEEIKKYEKSRGKSYWGEEFLNIVIEVFRVAEAEGYQVVGA
jgi:hypothetical protein